MQQSIRVLLVALMAATSLFLRAGAASASDPSQLGASKVVSSSADQRTTTG